MLGRWSGGCGMETLVSSRDGHSSTQEKWQQSFEKVLLEEPAMAQACRKVSRINQPYTVVAIMPVKQY
jgi:hypothetical protein